MRCDIKIQKHEIKDFPLHTLIIDDKWSDLLEEPVKKTNVNARYKKSKTK